MGTQAYWGVFSVGQSKDEIKSVGSVVKRTSFIFLQLCNNFVLTGDFILQILQILSNLNKSQT